MPVADPSPGSPCFNGADPSLPPGVCEPANPAASTPPKQGKKNKKKKQSGDKAGLDAREGYWGAALFGLLLGGLVAAPRGLKWGRQKWEDYQLKRQALQAQRVMNERAAASGSHGVGAKRGGSASKQTHFGAFSGKGNFAR